MTSIKPARDPRRIWIWLALVAFFGVIQASTNRLAGNDTYYHIKYAWLIWHEGALWDFHWMEGTFFKDHWVDKELLYHLFLIPFTLPGDMYWGAKVAGAVGGGTALFAGYLVIRSFGEPGSLWRKHSVWFALVLAAGSKAMLYRLSTARVPAASVAFMMLGLWLMNRKATRGLFVLGFFYAWMYHVSVVMVPFAIFFAIGQRLDSGRWDLRPTIATGAGLVAGFIFNPYFPDTLPVLFKHVIQVGLGSTGIPKGSEWAPYDSWYLMQTTSVTWFTLVAGMLALGGRHRPMSGRTLALLLCAGLMTAAFFKARRFVEYFPVFTIVFSASAIHDLIEDPKSWFWQMKEVLGVKLRWLQGALIITLLIVAGVNNWQASREAHQNAYPWRLAGAAKWLQENTPKDTQVYNAQWDVFPELIFHNHHNRWTLGLDPNFTYFVEPRLYHLSALLGNGQVPEPGRFVKENFGCEYAVAIKGSGFANVARQPHSGLEKVFEDEYGSVFKYVPDLWIRTVEAELTPFTTEPGDAAKGCQREEPKSGMGNPSARGFLMCKAPSDSVLKLLYEVEIPTYGDWEVEARFLTGGTPAQAQVSIDGEVQGEVVSLKADVTRLGRLERLGQRALPKGKHRIEVRFEGTPGPYEMFFGLDYVRLRRRPPTSSP